MTGGVRQRGATRTALERGAERLARLVNWNGQTDPGKTVWGCAADDVDRAETRLLDAMATGDDAEVAEAADHLASVQRRSGRLRKRTDAVGQRLVDAPGATGNT